MNQETKILLKNATGLDNKHHPERLPSEVDSETTALAAAVNLRVTSTGMLQRDNGYSLLESGNFHSIFAGQRECYLGKGSSLYLLQSDETLLGVRSGLSSGPYSFLSYGDSVLFSDRVAANGILLEGVSSPWPTHKYQRDTTRLFSPVPIARYMALASGRVYLSMADMPRAFCWSESGQIGLFNLTENLRLFESPITMVASLDTSIFVSTENQTHHLSIGENVIRSSSKHIIRKDSDTSPAIPESLLPHSVNASAFFQGVEGQCRVWRSVTGLCVGLASGQIISITEEQLNLPSSCASNGASVLLGDYLYHSVQ